MNWQLLEKTGWITLIKSRGVHVFDYGRGCDELKLTKDNMIHIGGSQGANKLNGIIYDVVQALRVTGFFSFLYEGS